MFGLGQSDGPHGTWDFWSSRSLVHARFNLANGVLASAALFVILRKSRGFEWPFAFVPLIAALAWSVLLPLTGANLEQIGQPSDAAKFRRIVQVILASWGAITIWILPVGAAGFILLR